MTLTAGTRLGPYEILAPMLRGHARGIPRELGQLVEHVAVPFIDGSGPVILPDRLD